MTTSLSRDVLSLLIRIGRSSDADGPELETMCAPLRLARRCATLHWSDWDEACSGLSIDDHVALLMGLTSAERHAGWEAGSVSPIIWVYRSLEPRVSMPAAQELARWVMARSNNPYLPFGSMVLARHFDPNEDLRKNAGLLSDILKSRRLASHLHRAADHERRTEAAKAERIERRARVVREHLERKELKEANRRALVVAGMALGATSRLRLVSERTDLPLLAFPAEWAEVGEEGLLGLSADELRRLRERTSSMKRGPWHRLYLRLSDTAEPSGGRHT